jgi:hypothetical protein
MDVWAKAIELGYFDDGHWWLGREGGKWIIAYDAGYGDISAIASGDTPEAAILAGIEWEEKQAASVAESQRKNEEAKAKLSFFREQA